MQLCSMLVHSTIPWSTCSSPQHHHSFPCRGRAWGLPSGHTASIAWQPRPPPFLLYCPAPAVLLARQAPEHSGRGAGKASGPQGSQCPPPQEHEPLVANQTSKEKGKQRAGVSPCSTFKGGPQSPLHAGSRQESMSFYPITFLAWRMCPTHFFQLSHGALPCTHMHSPGYFPTSSPFPRGPLVIEDETKVSPKYGKVEAINYICSLSIGEIRNQFVICSKCVFHDMVFPVPAFSPCLGHLTWTLRTENTGPPIQPLVLHMTPVLRNNSEPTESDCYSLSFY